MKCYLIIIISLLTCINLSGCNEFICKGYLGKQARLATEFFIPPRDLFDTVLREPILLNEVNSVYEYTFKLKYAGYYAIGLALNKMDYYSFSYENPPLKLSLKFEFYLSDDLLFTRKSVTQVIPVYSDYFGIDLAFFKAPEDMPINKTLRCKVKVLETDEEFLQKYGPAKLYVCRRWDL